MKKRLLVGLVTGLFLAGLVGVASATILQTWNDETAFLTDNIGLSMESFESTTSNNLPLTAGDITVTTDNTTYGFFNGINTNGAWGVTDGVQNIRYGADNGDSIFFDFSSPINSFGINIWGFGDNGGTPVLTFYDDHNNSETVLGTGMSGYEFFGLTSDMDISRVQFTATGTSGDGIYFDELYYGGGQQPVPEPATMLLFGTGLAGLVGMRRRKNKK